LRTWPAAGATRNKTASRERRRERERFMAKEG